LLVMVLCMTQVTAIVRPFWARVTIMLVPLLTMNLLSVGTVINPELEQIVSLLPIDTTFTGRTDIWTFAIQALQLRLPTGYGFAAFWGSSSVQNLPQGMEWAEYASHSHNGYLDTALAMGLPGVALLIAALVIAPLRDFQNVDRGGNNGPLAMMLLQIWLFGLYLSSMESFFLDRADPMWFTFLIAVFGLHYLARFRLRE
jgi:O-antigen ligase